MCLFYLFSFNLARPAGLEPATLGLAYQLPLSRPRTAGLWSGLSLRHLRRRTYSLYGTLRKSEAKFPPLLRPFSGASTLRDTFEPNFPGSRLEQIHLSLQDAWVALFPGVVHAIHWQIFHQHTGQP